MKTIHTLMLAFALCFAGCGGADAEPEPEAESTGGGEAETTVEVIPPEGEAGGGAEAEAPSTALATMSPTEGNEASGTVRFVQQEGGVLVSVELTGLEPGSRHGFHVHEHGDCSAPDGTSAGGHYDPAGADHALPAERPRHAGDMGNLEADDAGEVHAELEFDNFSVDRADPPPVVGRGVILHAEPDDGSQPTGAAGARIACGVIEAD
ncbi:MAG TPA: superoxide dismutase family protein [Sandaracinaceae bacterium LLY-WYZ-13_1]|nr:superoxide dismutase family protein [Sandaracinaceae bacterium LLY-WYZ-13_1]